MHFWSLLIFFFPLNAFCVFSFKINFEANRDPEFDEYDFDLSSYYEDNEFKPTLRNLNYSGLEDIQNRSHINLSFSNEFAKLAYTFALNDPSFLSKTLWKGIFREELQALNMSHGIIVEVEKNAFSGLLNLQYLDLSYNFIGKLHFATFAKNPKLEYLDISQNQIKVLPSGLFKYNNQLNWLDVSSNQISIIQLPFNLIKNMLFVSLANNSLIESPFPAAQSFKINNNQYERLVIGKSTKYLDASFNNITSVECGRSLKNDLGFKFLWGYFENINYPILPSIKTLILAHNPFNFETAFTQCIGISKDLVTLDLSFTNVGHIDNSAFETLTELETLLLRHAEVMGFSKFAFSSQTKLKNLDLSYNRLGSNISVEMLQSMSNLQRLYLDGNEMTEIDYVSLESSLPHLRVFGVGDNNFNCSYLGEFLEFFNNTRVQVIASSGKIVTDSTNIHGIGCTGIVSLEEKYLDTTLKPFGEHHR